MLEITKLITVLQPHLQWHRARLTCFAALTLAVIKMRSVNLAQLAEVINPRCPHASNYRRLQRFFAHFDPGADTLTRLLLALRPDPDEPLTLVIDRTEWKFGTKRVNLLTVGYLLDGLTIPLRWRELGRGGNSNYHDRRAVLEPLLGALAGLPIRALVADREFIGVAFLAWLQEHDVPFVIRIRKNARLRRLARRAGARGVLAGEVFSRLAVGARWLLAEPWVVYGHRLHVVAAREGKEPWILVTNARPEEALRLYGQRWSIETTFGALKRRGFDLETTHLRHSERLERLVGVLALALLWAVKVGLWRHRRQAIRVKKHRRRAVSLFRYGLDYLRQCLLWHDEAALRPALRLLSCT
jgi:hypothetical protein